MNDQLVTLITGTSRGIGLELAKYFVTKGHFVYGCSRSPTNFNHENYKHHLLDVTDEKKVQFLFEQIAKEKNRIDHLVNNAAIARINPALLTSASQLREFFNVNTVSAFCFCQEAARMMRRNNFGRIVNISSIAVAQHLEGVLAYASSKAALEELTKIFSKEVGDMGITVNCVGPGIIETDMGSRIPKSKADLIFQKQAIKEKITPLDVANIIDFLFSPASKQITGQTIYLGGP